MFFYIFIFYKCIKHHYVRLNPELDLDIYNLAIYDKNGTVFYEVLLPLIIFKHLVGHQPGF